MEQQMNTCEFCQNKYPFTDHSQCPHCIAYTKYPWLCTNCQTKNRAGRIKCINKSCGQTAALDKI